MKKFILPLVIFVFVLFSPFDIFAQSSTDCWPTHMVRQYAECTPPHTACLKECSYLDTTPKRKVCFDECDRVTKLCTDEAVADYRTCVNTSKKPSTPQSAEKSELKENESEDCWGKYMAADGCSPQYAACTTECPKDASAGQRACEDACSKTSQACRDNASANYKACVAANTKEERTKSELSEDDIIYEDGTPLNLFGVNPMATWQNIWEFAKSSLAFLDVGDVGYFFLGSPEVVNLVDETPGSIDTGGKSWNFLPGFIPSGDGKTKVNNEKKPADSGENKEIMFKYSDLPKRTPELTEEIIRQYREERENMMGSGQKEISPYSIDILKGQAQIKYPNESQWSDVKVGEKIPQGSTIFTGMDTTTILAIEGVGVVEIAPFTEIKIDQSGIEQAKAKKEIFTDIKLRKGEIEVNVEKGVFTAPILDVHTPNATTSIRGTHFWVSYKDNQTAVGVYEGKVEVKTNDGKTTEVTPNDNQPGVRIVFQKLSPFKVVIAGLILLVVIGGGFLLLKKKFTSKIVSKKKK